MIIALRPPRPTRPALTMVAAAVLAGALAACSSAGTPAPTAPATAAPAASASVAASASPSAGPSTAATTGPCDAARLAARITLWEGAAGSRIAHVDLTNTGTAPCLLAALARPQLVDGKGSVLIESGSGASGAPSAAVAASAAPALTLAAGGVVRTLVRAGNYCGPAATAPVSVAFVLTAGGRLVATAFSPTDSSVPPCLGAPGSAGTIEMQAWAP